MNLSSTQLRAYPRSILSVLPNWQTGSWTTHTKGLSLDIIIRSRYHRFMRCLRFEVQHKKYSWTLESKHSQYPFSANPMYNWCARNSLSPHPDKFSSTWTALQIYQLGDPISQYSIWIKMRSLFFNQHCILGQVWKFQRHGPANGFYRIVQQKLFPLWKLNRYDSYYCSQQPLVKQTAIIRHGRMDFSRCSLTVTLTGSSALVKLNDALWTNGQAIYSERNWAIRILIAFPVGELCRK